MLDRTRNFPGTGHHAMHVPRTMFAAAIDRFGGPEVITAHALPVPEVDAGEVLIAVDTAGVGRWDADVREGRVAHPNGIEPAPRKRRGVKLIRYDGISGVREFERLNAAVQAARLRVSIAECYPLPQASKAHERLAEGHVVGKIILAVHDHSV
jgi:NADPH:quinone reductase-like Zn-dependent oxidoreductase